MKQASGVTAAALVLLVALVAGCGPDPDPNYPRPGQRVNHVKMVARFGDEVGWCWMVLTSNPPICGIEHSVIGVDPALVRLKQGDGTGQDLPGYYEFLHLRGAYDDDLNLVVSEVMNDPDSSNPATGGTTTTTIMMLNGVPTPMIPSPNPEEPTRLFPVPNGTTGVAGAT